MDRFWWRVLLALSLLATVAHAGRLTVDVRLTLHGTVITQTASIGIALVSGSDDARLPRNADVAMHAAKQRAKATSGCSSPVMHAAAVDRRQLQLCYRPEAAWTSRPWTSPSNAERPRVHA